MPFVPEVISLLSIQLAAFQALLLAASAVHKLIGRRRARTVAQEFAGVTPSLAGVVVIAVAMAELAAGVCSWIPSCRAAGAVLAVLIWGGYLSLLLRAIAAGRRDVDCGCSFGATQRPLGVFQVVRNLVLIGIAVAVGLLSANGAAAPVMGSQALAAIALLALYGALDQVMALTPLRSGEVL